MALKEPYVTWERGLFIVAFVLLGIMVTYTVTDWNTREDYVDQCIVQNYTKANGFPPDLRSFCISSWRQL